MNDKTKAPEEDKKPKECYEDTQQPAPDTEQAERF